LFADRKLGLETVLMTEPADIFAALLAVIAFALIGNQQQMAGFGPEEARKQAEQRGLARAIGAFHRQRVATLQPEVEAFKQDAVTPRAGEIFGGQG